MNVWSQMTKGDNSSGKCHDWLVWQLYKQLCLTKDNKGIYIQRKVVSQIVWHPCLEAEPLQCHCGHKTWQSTFQFGSWMSPTIPNTTSHHHTTLTSIRILGFGLFVTRSLPYRDFLCTGFLFGSRLKSSQKCWALSGGQYSKSLSKSIFDPSIATRCCTAKTLSFPYSDWLPCKGEEDYFHCL